MEPHTLTISKASSLISSTSLSPVDLLESLLRRIDQLEPEIDAWVTVDREGAMEAAAVHEAEAEAGLLRGSLHGIPVGVKDIFYTKGLRTTMGSPIYRDFVPVYDAAAVAKLKEAGAIILGKTETTEFAVSDPAPTKNPWNTEYTPGGSSSGSAAAVSSSMCPSALGTQTGGSVTRPASFCGVVGMKPTYDLISRKGVFPLSWSLDHVGFFTRTVEDAALMLDVFAKVSEIQDWKSSDDIAPPQLGLLRGFFEEYAEKEVWVGFVDAIERLKDAGAEVAEIPLPPSFNVVHAAHRLIMASEAASVHQDHFRTKRDKYRVGIRGLVSSGLLVPASAYVRAQRIRAKFIKEAENALRSVDCLVTPSAPTPALWGLESTGDPVFNAPWSLCGFPTVTIPSGLTKNELPLGMQLIDAHFQEKRLLEIARWCETGFSFRKPPRDIV